MFDAVSMDCDHIVFNGETATLSQNDPILSYSQRNSGLKSISSQVSHTRSAVKNNYLQNNLLY